jgi:hypothetical protein
MLNPAALLPGMPVLIQDTFNRIFKIEASVEGFVNAFPIICYGM